MTVWTVEYVDYDGGRRGMTWSLKLYFNKEDAMHKANSMMKRKSWPDEVWEERPSWISEAGRRGYASSQEERPRVESEWWCSNKKPMLIIVDSKVVE